MKLIPLTRGKSAMVDNSDYGIISLINWHFNPGKNVDIGYAFNASFGQMHRLLVDVDIGEEVDHIDGNPLNNQRSNLRVCTHAQNNCNKPKKKNGSSIYKGVWWSNQKMKWLACIRINGKNTHIGTFKTQEQAAKAYDLSALKHHGEFAYVNFKEVQS